MRIQLRRAVAAMSAASARSLATSKVTGLARGPYAVGIKTIQLTDDARQDGGAPRKLQTEVWYPAVESATEPSSFSDFLCGGDVPSPEIIKAAERPDAIGGYADALTIAQIDATWPGISVRNAEMASDEKWPVVAFSHGSGAYRASYAFWTEHLASHGYVVCACDHPGSARFTVVDGQVITPGGERSKRARMEADRVADVKVVLDGVIGDLGDAVDADKCAVTGMSFGGWTTAAYLETKDPRVKAAVLMCPSLSMSDGGRLGNSHTSTTPALVMVGREDTVIGAAGNAAAADYATSHQGPAAYLEIVRGGHCSFTSGDLYNPAYGNGIGPSKSLAGGTYEPLAIAEQHAVCNTYGLAFLDAHLKGRDLPKENRSDAAEVLWEAY
jgi:dienelactone hydrolase